MARPNILFLMVDCLRADVLWDRQRYPEMPNLDRVVESSTVFSNAVAAATTTTPSVATMLTGDSPAEHGIRSLPGYKLRTGVRTLAEELRDGGYHTVAEVTGPLFPETGLDRGLLHYRRRDRQQYLDSEWRCELHRVLEQRRLPAASKKRILTLGKRFLLERRQPSAEKVDPKAPRPEVAGHAALCVYDYLARVPFVVAAPGRLPTRWIDYQVRHVDIAPTVVDLAGLQPDPYRWSRPMTSMARDHDILDRPAVTEALQTMLHDPIRRLIGYRTGRHKLTNAPEISDVPPELYDLCCA